MSSRFWKASGNPLLPSHNIFSTGVAWTPATLGASLFWWAEPKPANLTKLGGGTPVDGDQVSAITDLSGNSISLSQATAGNYPLYHTDGSSHYWLTFSGTTYLASPGVVTVNDGSGQHTTFATVNPSSTTGVQSIIDHDGGTSTRMTQNLRTNAGTLESLAFNNAVAAFTDAGPAVGSGVVHVLSEVTTTTSVEAFVDGTTAGGSTAITGTLVTGTNNMTIGAHYNTGSNYAGNWYGGFIAGIISGANMTSAQSYMRALAP